MTSYLRALRPMTVAFAAAGMLVFPLAVSAFQQAPSLDGQDLPPVDERLPASPEVVMPLEAVAEPMAFSLPIETSVGLPPSMGIH